MSSAPPPAVPDLSTKLPLAGRVSARIVPDHILGQAKLPGGTLGEYEEHGKTYQLFIVQADSAQKAAFLLVDLKDSLRSPEYLAHMGGYFGNDGKADVFAFAKLNYLAGVVGLPRDQADPIARTLAAHLR